ncbi:hypothetical protein P9112_013311 [Eukaryota sp. TZLM1-RC]
MQNSVKKINELQDQLTTKNSLINSLEQQVNSLENFKGEVNEIFVENLDGKTDVDLENSNPTVKISSLFSKNSQLFTELNEVKSELGTYIDDFGQLQLENSELININQIQSAENQELLSKITELKSNLTENSSKLEVISIENAEFCQKINELQDQLTSKNSLINSLEQQVNSLENFKGEVNEIFVENLDGKTDVDLENSNPTVKILSLFSKNSQLFTELNEVKSELGTYIDDFGQLQLENSELININQIQSAENQELIARISLLNHSFTALNADNDQNLVKIHKLCNQNGTLIEELEYFNENHSTFNLFNQNLINDYEERVLQLETYCEYLTDYVYELKNNLSLLSDELNQSIVDEAEKARFIDDITARHEELNSEYLILNDTLVSQKKHYEDQLSTLKISNDELKISNDELKVANEELISNNTQLLQSLSDLKSLSNQNSELKTLLKISKQQLQYASQQQEILLGNSTKFKNLSTCQEEKLKMAGAEILTLQKSLHHLNTDYEDLKSSIPKIVSHYTNVISENLNASRARVSGELAEAQKSIDFYRILSYDLEQLLSQETCSTFDTIDSNLVISSQSGLLETFCADAAEVGCFSINSEAESLKTQLSNANQQLRKAQADQDQLQGRVEALSFELQKARDEGTATFEQLSQREAKVKELEAELMSSKALSEELQREDTDLHAALQKETELLQFNQKLEEEISALHQQRIAEISDLEHFYQDKLNEMRSNSPQKISFPRINILENFGENLEPFNENLSSSNSPVSPAIENLMNKLDENSVKSRDPDSDQILNHRIELLLETITELNHQICLNHVENTSLRNRIVAITSQKNEIFNLFEVQSQCCSTMQMSNFDFDIENFDVDSNCAPNLSSLNITKIFDLNFSNQLLKLNKEKSIQCGEISNSNVERAHPKGEFEILEMSLNSLETSIMFNNDKTSQFLAIINDNQKEITGLQDSLSEVDDKLKLSLKENEELRSKLKIELKYRQNLEKNMTIMALRQQNSSPAQKSPAQKSKRLQETPRQKSPLGSNDNDSEISELRTKISSLSQQNSVLREAKSVLESLNSELSSQLSRERQSTSHLKNLNYKQAEILASKEEELIKAQSTMTQLRQKISTLSQKIVTLESLDHVSEISRLSQTVDKLTSVNDLFSSSIQSISDRISGLEAVFDELKNSSNLDTSTISQNFISSLLSETETVKNAINYVNQIHNQVNDQKSEEISRLLEIIALADYELSIQNQVNQTLSFNQTLSRCPSVESLPSNLTDYTSQLSRVMSTDDLLAPFHQKSTDNFEKCGLCAHLNQETSKIMVQYRSLKQIYSSSNQYSEFVSQLEALSEQIISLKAQLSGQIPPSYSYLDQTIVALGLSPLDHDTCQGIGDLISCLLKIWPPSDFHRVRNISKAFIKMKLALQSAYALYRKFPEKLALKAISSSLFGSHSKSLLDIIQSPELENFAYSVAKRPVPFKM